ncbi:hypothetical protein CERSUDRAFT_98325 [Gelatoporia subvermispora B]|uniref:F-box domain-containing protein n=1 Tax=Ceriporiopsis subvermispora (strain B) TaxID=914234 RepID=M2R4D0_CERS8|nr:hypothetical protein CERSUDRAFT_98325 [Gelatoporia subvermispora B]
MTSYTEDMQGSRLLSGKFTLNHDVLDHVLSLLPRDDLLNAVLTSRDFHTWGVPYLVQYAGVDGWKFRTTARIQAFHSFMFVGAPRRFEWLHRLSLVLEPRLNLIALELLAQIIESANNLHSLELCVYDQVFEQSTRIRASLASRVGLEHLSIKVLEYSGVGTMGVLADLKLPLRSLEVNIRNYARADARNVFRWCAKTLETLSVQTTYFEHSDVVYPRLHTLRVHNPPSELSPVQLSDWARSFPCLTSLILPVNVLLSGRGFERVQSLRMGDVSGSGSQSLWHSLTYLESHVLCIHQAGLACQVDHLKLYAKKGEAKMVEAALRDIQPAHLDMTIHQYTYFQGYGRVHRGHEFSGIFAQALPRLWILELALLLSWVPEQIQFLMDDICTMLSPLRITTLTIHFREDTAHTFSRERFMDEDDNPFPEFLAILDKRASELAKRITACVTTLCEISVCCSSDSLDFHKWRVEGKELVQV